MRVKIVWEKRHYRRQELAAHCADCGEVVVQESWEQAWYHVSRLICGCGEFRTQRSG
jgi:hypothetical protein